ncbi:hypothetical protein [Shewanella acanthi]|uniref:hypothetical protein n=1 Tax=Shewanella acanthi TaxID=2864212 RepID=UPI001C6583D3|nr:hypothetical protein [Shewanella acanthi]QYJ79432.1 hypothetical protein K0H61_03005 [Shewanella acanthi]
MTINRNNLKIQKPEVLGSNSDAGGQRTKNTVIAGELNQLFKAISDIDHATSAVDVVKCFPWVDTPGTETLLDGHIFVSAPPTDPLVSILIAESSLLNDASRMTDMIDMLESSVRAGQLIRRGLIGLLAGQDSFPRAYLQTMYRYNDKDIWANVRLGQGQIICISVEYAGNENALYPRFEHFCEIKESVTGGQEGQVYFSPPIPYDTPDASVIINGETGCTKLRYTSENADIKYHGVSLLTAENNSTLLSVGSTRTELLPKIRQVAVSAGNKITVDDSADVASSLVHNTITRSGNGGTTYIYNVPELMDDPYFATYGIKHVEVIGLYSWAATISITGTTVTVTYTTAMSSNQTIGIKYFSSLRYSSYSSASAFPAAKKLTIGTVKASATFSDSNYGTITLTEYTGGELRESNGRVVATINYLTGVVTKNTDSRGAFTVAYDALVEDSAISDNSVSFALSQPEPILDSFYVVVSTTSDTLLSGSSDSAGNITGTGITGTIENGMVTLSFSANVDLTTLSYDISETVTLNPPPELYGLNPLRLPSGGVVNHFNDWTPISIEHTNVQVVANPAPAQIFNVRTDARFVDITDSLGASLWTIDNTHFSHNSATGVVTLNSDFTGFVAPFVLTDTIGEEALVTEVKEGALQLSAELSRTYPVGSIVASIQNLGDLQARTGPVRDMTAWSNNWDVDGTNAVGSMNVVDYPIEVSNETAINEDWVLIFTSSTAFRCVGKGIGQIATGDILNDFAPINPLTLLPYFVIRQQAFNEGWQTGEAVRFRTYASSKPAMLIRTVASGHSQITTDRTTIAFRGNES